MPAQRRPSDDALRPTAAAPHGGLTDEEIASARRVPAHLESALQLGATAGFVLVDFTGTARAQLERSGFSAAWFGGTHLVVGAADDGCTGGECGWLDSCSVAPETPPAAVLDKVLEVWRGWPPPLTRSVDAPWLRRCLVCSDVLDEPPLVCSACRSVSFCSRGCQLAEMRAEGGLSHTACCALLARHRQRDVAVRLDSPRTRHACEYGREGGSASLRRQEGGGSWTDACMGNEAREQSSMCRLLERLHLHDGSTGYRALCGCQGAGPLAALEVSMLPEQPAVEREGTGRMVAGHSTALPIAPRSWAECYDALQLDVSRPVALLLAFPLTLHYALASALAQHAYADSSGMDLTAPSRPVHGPADGHVLRVHVLGASDACEGRLVEAYSCLSKLYPRGTRLQIDMCGPQLSPEASRSAVFESAQGVTINVNFHQALYHVWAGSQANRALPHLILAHNAGICEYESWRPTLELLQKWRTPLAFTSYAEIEVLAAHSKLREWLGHGAVELTTELNPFRQPLASEGMMSGGAVAVPWISNGFLTRVRFKSSISAHESAAVSRPNGNLDGNAPC